MLKSKNPEKIWEHTNEDIWLTKVNDVVDKITTKFFWIIWNNTSERYWFTKWMRIYNSKFTSQKKQKSEILISEILKNELKTEGIAFEIFLQYFIEKYWKTNVWIVPAELDFYHKVDCIIYSNDIKFWFDIKIWSNWSGKRKKIIEHAKNIDNPNYLPKDIIHESDKISFKESPVNIEHYSNNFLCDTNWVMKINSLSKITKEIKKNNFLQEAYNKYIENDWMWNIEDYIRSDIVEDFKFIWEATPLALEKLVILLKSWDSKTKKYTLDNWLWRIVINQWDNSDTPFDVYEITMYKWNQSKTFSDFFIPITKKLLKKI